MTERIKLFGTPAAEQTEKVKYMLGRQNRPITFYLCCDHCKPCVMINRHPTPCQHVDDFGYKDCIVGEMPV